LLLKEEKNEDEKKKYLNAEELASLDINSVVTDNLFSED
jgi:hypothetical protein